MRAELAMATFLPCKDMAGSQQCETRTAAFTMLTTRSQTSHFQNYAKKILFL